MTLDDAFLARSKAEIAPILDKGARPGNART